ncbi:PREDICTED: dehydrogenase/reductase SDR family member 13 [Tinamus guttatus]|uniref:dehydrogenase/reductase SDR family member 13 n=1 Tax=Tinamus guttatus TaxID=94827 RepID=UPI00052EDAC8|nr:PREDICTED: dehydrogenase/reductase SDR family member 13 [Tinamus guttatus]
MHPCPPAPRSPNPVHPPLPGLHGPKTLCPQETGNAQVLFMHLDLASLSSVRAFAEAVLRQEPELQQLLNNAACGALAAFQAYCDSKLANVLHARELARRLRGTGVTCYAVHPGTALQTGMAGGDARCGSLGTVCPFALGIPLHGYRDAAAGAETPLFCATREGIERFSGGYFSDCRPREPWRPGGDDELARALWEASELLVGLPPK